jgi:sugar-specific transcriptional regulator TrmB
VSDGDSMGEHAAVEALERLGLSNYEARVFLALQKLGTGTAREIHEVAEVPRSQVYGAADALEERGLVEIQRSTPKRYRPVSLDAARAHLTAELERERERAFEYLESVQRDRDGDETREDVWTIRGRGPIGERLVELASRANDSILFAADAPEFVTASFAEALVDEAAGGIDVTVVSANAAVRDLFEDTDVVTVGVDGGSTEYVGRVCIVDDDVILLSAVGGGDLTEETAIWSARTALAIVLVRITRDGIETLAYD